MGYLFILFFLLLLLETISVFYEIFERFALNRNPVINPSVKMRAQKPTLSQAEKQKKTEEMLDQLALSFDLNRTGKYHAQYGELMIDEENYQFNEYNYPHYQNYDFMFSVLTLQKKYLEKRRKIQARITKLKEKEQKIRNKIENLK